MILRKSERTELRRAQAPNSVYQPIVRPAGHFNTQHRLWLAGRFCRRANHKCIPANSSIGLITRSQPEDSAIGHFEQAKIRRADYPHQRSRLISPPGFAAEFRFPAHRSAGRTLHKLAPLTTHRTNSVPEPTKNSGPHHCTISGTEVMTGGTA